MPSTKLHVKPKDDIVIKLTQCLDKYKNFYQKENSSIERSFGDLEKNKPMTYGWIMALKWVLGYDQLHKVDNEDGITMHTDDEYEPDPHYNDEINMSKL